MFETVKNLLAKKGWWNGQVTISYNLMWLLIILGILLLPVILAVAAVVVAVLILWWFAGVVMDVIIAVSKWLYPHVLDFCNWLWSLLLKFWAWIKSLFQGKQKDNKPVAGKKNNWWWLLAAILLLLLLLLSLFKGCGSDEPAMQEPEPREELVIYQSSWNDALYARVYLDGLKNDATLAGYKYRDGKLAKNAEFNGNAASEAWDVMFEEWLPVLQDNITANLNDNQRVATWLYALRSGKYGFAKSDFVKAVNAGDMDKAGEYLFKIHKANGTVRSSGDELKSYLYVIRLIWDGEISIEELKDCHCFSYKAYSVSKGYHPESLIEVITTKNPLGAKTPRELID